LRFLQGWGAVNSVFIGHIALLLTLLSMFIGHIALLLTLLSMWTCRDACTAVTD
jgi:hypothetical protein